jgi:hypothetical protein
MNATHPNVASTLELVILACRGFAQPLDGSPNVIAVKPEEPALGEVLRLDDPRLGAFKADVTHELETILGSNLQRWQ